MSQKAIKGKSVQPHVGEMDFLMMIFLDNALDIRPRIIPPRFLEVSISRLMLSAIRVFGLMQDSGNNSFYPNATYAVSHVVLTVSNRAKYIREVSKIFNYS